MTRAIRLFARGFLLEACFNAKGQQRGGAAWALSPAREGFGSQAFNANPSVAGYALGLAAQVEGDDFARHRSALTSTLGSLGDRILFTCVRPLAVVSSLVVAAVHPIAAAISLLIVYNAIELPLRYRSAVRGLSGLTAVLADLSKEGLPRWTKPFARATGLALGLSAGFWIPAIHGSVGASDLAGALVALGAGGLVLRGRHDQTWAGPIGALLVAVMGILCAGALRAVLR